MRIIDFFKSYGIKNCFTLTFSNIRIGDAAPCKSTVKRNVNACKFFFYGLFH
jgi:hypothetical protein